MGIVQHQGRPYRTHNLIGKYPEMAKELETAYFEWADKSDVLYFQKMWNTYNKNRRKDFKEYKTR